MDQENEKMYLQNIEEYVLDEEKIVTYKWLSKMLNIHVNLSKQLLYSFYTDVAHKNSIQATFLLAGRLRETGNHHVTIVGEDKLKNVKSLFDSLSSEHIYSVQKCRNSLSSSTLFTADNQPTGNSVDNTLKLSAIRCNESIQRTAEEMTKLRINIKPALAHPSKKPSVPSISVEKKTSSEEEKKAAPAPKAEAKNKGSIAAMFAAQGSKPSSSKSPPSTATKDSVKNSKKGGGISSFFNKVNKDDTQKSEEVNKLQETSKEAPVIQSETTTGNKKFCEEKNPGNEQSSVCKGSESAPKKPKLESTSELKVQNKRLDDKKKRGKDKKTRKEVPKKRKRIVVPEDSDSSGDDMFASDHDHSRESSPEHTLPILKAKALESEDEDVIPSTPCSDTSKGHVRRRRKVVKDKTFKDEDGYIVTEKVTEYESYSESDTEKTDDIKKLKGANGNNNKNNRQSVTEKKKEIEKSKEEKVAPKKVSPVKNKQQSLMSFFKKKEN